MKAQPDQAHLEAERRRIEAARAMPPWRKVQLACELGELENAVLWVHIRMEKPGFTHDELEREFLNRRWGPELAASFLIAREEHQAKCAARVELPSESTA